MVLNIGRYFHRDSLYQKPLLSSAITADNLNAIQDELIRVGGSGTLPVADYVVEQGTSGIWTYRKWNSGIAECWTTSTLNTTGTPWANVMGGYGFYVGYDLPSGLFISPPLTSGNGRTGSGGGFVSCTVSLRDVTAYIVGNQDDPNLTLDIFAKGKWK